MNPGSRDFALDPQDLARLLVSLEQTRATLKGWPPCMNRTLRSPAETDGLQLAQTLLASSILKCWRLGEHLISGSSGQRCFVRTWRSLQRALQMVS
jgi:hypothetical protein